MDGKHNVYFPALTGIRFFAIMHIFLYHLWVLYDMTPPEPFTNLLADVALLPDLAERFISHGWLSTSFFFLLSGFILAVLYMRPSGEIAGGNRSFWIKRFSRIYPIHLIIGVITILLIGGMQESYLKAIPAFVATLALVQSWFPPWVPAVSWPTWTLSALVFLYFITPWLMRVIAKLTARQALLALIAMPLVSIIPTAVMTLIVEDPSQFTQNESIFVGSFPPFWVAHFAAGILLAKVSGISRFSEQSVKPKRLIALGDIALIAVIALALVPGLDEPLKYFLRHGLVMPLYMVIIVDLARHQGLAARLFSLPGTQTLGDASFSLFVWQNFVMIWLWGSLQFNQNAGDYHLQVAVPAIIILSLASTRFIEKPIARKLRRKWLEGKPPE